MFLSDAYIPDDAVNQAFANYVASLVHGPELGKLTVYVAAPGEIAPLCGSDLALACYSDRLNAMAVNGNPGPGEAIEETIAHEYGHHVANHRDNDPWPALAWGPKRWATYEGICPRYENGEVFPGNEGDNYSLNPGEGFAQAYAVLNLGPAWSDVFDRSFFPDQSSLDAIRSDVLDPWTANGYFTKRGRFRGRRSRSRYYTLRTPLDGRMKISLRSPRHADFDLYVYYRNRLVAKARSRRRTDTIRGVNCGAGKFKIEVYRYRGRGRFSLQTTVP